MVVSGLQRNEDHAEQISIMALEILHRCSNFQMKHLPSVPMLLRIGIHTGQLNYFTKIEKEMEICSVQW